MDKESDSIHEVAEEDTEHHFEAAKLSNWQSCLAMQVQWRLEVAAVVHDRPSLRKRNSVEEAGSACEEGIQAGELSDCWWPVVMP